jgi:hypothetical protein
MRSLKKLKITESIQSKRLVFKESWFDKFDTVTIYLVFLLLAGISILCLEK